jgi:hypothetical protein
MTTLLNSEWEIGGIRTESYSDNDGHDLVIRRLQDVSPILEYNHFLRGEGEKHWRGEDNTMWHYARIPVMVMEELIIKLGADVVLGGKDTKRLLSEIEQNYPYLKVGGFSLA